MTLNFTSWQPRLANFWQSLDTSDATALSAGRCWSPARGPNPCGAEAGRRLRGDPEIRKAEHLSALLRRRRWRRMKALRNELPLIDLTTTRPGDCLGNDPPSGVRESVNLITLAVSLMPGRRSRSRRHDRGNRAASLRRSGGDCVSAVRDSPRSWNGGSCCRNGLRAGQGINESAPGQNRIAQAFLSMRKWLLARASDTMSRRRAPHPRDSAAESKRKRGAVKRSPNEMAPGLITLRAGTAPTVALTLQLPNMTETRRGLAARTLRFGVSLERLREESSARSRGLARTLVGRSLQVETLKGLVSSMAHGRGALLCLTGGGHWQDAARDGAPRRLEKRVGPSVHWGRTWEGGGAPPMWPWIQVLRSLARGRSAAFQQAANALIEPVSAPGVAAVPLPNSEAEQFAWMVSLTRLLAAAAEEGRSRPPLRGSPCGGSRDPAGAPVRGP